MSQLGTTQGQYSLQDLLRIMQRLRDPQTGCPWDLKQNFQSIVPSTLEECYELAAAIESEDYAHLADELGDVLFQVIFYSQLGSEQQLFDFGVVVDGLCQKLLRRHPHVFANGEIEGLVDSDSDVTRGKSREIDSQAVKAQWEKIKAQERASRSQHGALDDVPLNLPALPRAQKLQKRAARVGLDWHELDGVLAKLDEEIAELRQAIQDQDGRASADELGDVLFTAVNVARHLDCDAETSLRNANAKFERRFGAIEARAAEEGIELPGLDAQDWERLWAFAKQLEHKHDMS